MSTKEEADTHHHHHHELTRDEAVLASLGYKQTLKRHFSPFETFGISFSIIGLVPSMASVLIYAIPNGGPVSMVWGWGLASVFIMFISLSLAELGSAAPTSGGLYYWVHKFASPNSRNLLAWLVGYADTAYLVAGVASVALGCAVQIMACASIGSGLTFSATTAQTFGVYTAVLVAQGLIASLATKLLARLQNLYILLNFLLIVALIASVAAATPSEFRNTAKFAFGDFENFNGWPNGYAFILGFLAPLWTIGGFDAAVHISEEANNAPIAVPWAMITAPFLSGVLGWAINVALAFCMGTDLTAILEDPIGQPMATILFNSLGTRGALTIFACIVCVQFMLGTSLLVATSRQVYAFSRDGALPFSSYISHISHKTQTPIHSVWFALFFSYLLGLLSFAGPTAIAAIFSLTVSAQYLAYTIAIVTRFAFRNDFKAGPFNLGRFSKPVALVAVLWMCFIIVVFLFPTTPQVTAQDMNYTVVVLGGWLILSFGMYYFPKYGGVYWFKGPVKTIDSSVEDLTIDRDSVEKVSSKTG